MSDKVTVDFSEVNQLAAQLGSVPANAGRYVRSAVEVSARNVKDSWRDDAKGQLGTPGFPASIDYEVQTAYLFGQSVIQAEIGPNKSRGGQAKLGNLIEYGGASSGGLSSKIGTGAAALERTQEDFVRGLSNALADAENVIATDASLSRSVSAVLRGGY